MTLSLRYAALSDVGRVRKDNQDSGFASQRLLVIADGVGGAARGDVASSTAVQILRRLDAPPTADLLEAMAGAIHRAHDRIAELVDDDPELEGTSTTVTAALFDGTQVAIGHVGDSRGYLFRDGEISQLTKDHTFVQSLIDEGRITEEESRVHPHRNLILRAVDGVHDTDPDLFLVDVAPGDRILLCSDGCSGVLDNDRLADILSGGTVDYAAVELVRASLEAGSTDNITCVVADIIDEDAPADDGPVAARATGPMLVGAADEQPRKAGAVSKSFFRGHRGGDTGELEPVPGEVRPANAPAQSGRGETGSAKGAPVDPEELRYAPRPPRRFTWVRRIAILVAIATVLALIATMAYRWTQDQYFVAANADRVAIYRGVQADVPGLNLTSVHEETAVELDSLPDFRAEQVRDGIAANNLAAARDIVSRLDELAQDCAPPPSATPTPRPSGKASPTAKPTDDQSRKPSPTPSPRPSRQPSATASPGGDSTKSAGPTSGPSSSPSDLPADPCVEGGS